MTGDTANGRSISVTSRLLPRNSKRAIAQAAQMPKTVLTGTTIAAVSSVSLIEAIVSGSLRLANHSPKPLASACTSTAPSGASSRSPRKPTETAMSATRAARAPRVSGRTSVATLAPAAISAPPRCPCRRWPQPCTRLIANSITKDIASMKKPSAAAPS